MLGGFLPAAAHRPRSRRHHEAAVQRRHQPGEPAADAPQHPRSDRGAGAISSRSIPIRTSSSARTAACRGLRTDSRRPTRIPYARHSVLGREPHQLHPQQRQGRHRRLRRHDDVLRVRHRRSDHRGLPGHLSDAVQGRERDAAGPPQPRALSRAAAEGAGGRVRPVPHGRARGVLQPRGSLDRRQPGQPDATSASRPRSRWSRTSC